MNKRPITSKLAAALDSYICVQEYSLLKELGNLTTTEINQLLDEVEEFKND
jgi:hypothetical protein